jgi:hypothetical protein
MKTKLHFPFVLLAYLAIAFPSAAQNTVVTYQGQVTDNGTNFSGTGQFEFALVTSTNTSSQAAVTATMGGSAPHEYVAAYNLIFGGNGYTSAPTITITGGGGSGAAATAVLTGAQVTAINFISPGSGYSSTPSVTVAPPPADIVYTSYWNSDGSSGSSEPLDAVSVGVTNGLFTVELGNTALANMAALPTALFTQPNLQLRIWFSDGVNGFSALSPAQNLTPTPYADFANTSSNVSGTISSSSISGAYLNGVTLNNAANIFNGTYSGNGANVTNVNAAALGGLTPSNFWQLSGNNVIPGQFLGSTNSNPVEVWVGGSRAFRLEPGSGDGANVIGGYSNNFVSPGIYSATIAGGGYPGKTNRVTGFAGAVGGGYNNASSNLNATVSGGANNVAGGNASFVGGGSENFAGGDHDAIGGGQANYISAVATDAVIAGGGGAISQNGILDGASFSAIGGGGGNFIQTNAYYSAIGGGSGNYIQVDSFYSAIGGGYANTVLPNAEGGTIGGGAQNTNGGGFTTIGGGQGNFANNEYAAISGGYFNTNIGWVSSIGGGQANLIGPVADHSTIAGGANNSIVGSYNFDVYSAIGGGQFNSILTNALYSSIGGGSSNTVTASYATIPGGTSNLASGQFSYAAGQQAQALYQGDFVWADSQNAPFPSSGNDQFLIRAQGGVGINTTNPAGALSVNTGGAGTLTIRNEGNLVPALVVTNGNGYSGYLRFRNVLEIFPNDAGTESGYLDIRNAAGAGTIALDGSTGNITGANFFGNAAGLTNLSLTGSYTSAVTLNNVNNIFGGAYSGNGGGLTNVNAAQLNGLAATNFWQTGGNSGTTAGVNYLGTSDNQALELHVNGGRALRLEPSSGVPNVVGGYSGNLDGNGAQGVTIGGGGASGFVNQVSASLGTVAGGSGNTIGTNANDATIGGGRQNIIDTNSWGAVIAGGHGNWIQPSGPSGGGLGNASYATISGGYGNVIETNANYGSIGGGASNSIAPSSAFARIGGGEYNAIAMNANYSFIGGGLYNTNGGVEAILAGGLSNYVAAGYATIGGGNSNTNIGYGATIGGGQNNEASANNATVCGGYNNVAAGNDSVVAGYQNQALGISAVITGGGNNLAGINAENSFIGSGSANNITAQGATIGGGYNNTNTGNYAAIGGGYFNLATNAGATVPGGSNNLAGGGYSFAAGVNAQALNTGAFVWSDSSGAATMSTNANSVTMRANGGYRFMTSDIGTTTGAYLAAGGGGWVSLSDRNSKENFQPVDAGEVLAKVAALPMSSWNYKTQDASVRHIGPMAQDFKASFQVGETDTGICTVDEEGVALAAIQGLNQKLSEKELEISALKEKADKVDSLEKQLNELQIMVKQLAAQK